MTDDRTTRDDLAAQLATARDRAEQHADESEPAAARFFREAAKDAPGYRVVELDEPVVFPEESRAE